MLYDMAIVCAFFDINMLFMMVRFVFDFRYMMKFNFMLYFRLTMMALTLLVPPFEGIKFF